MAESTRDTAQFDPERVLGLLDTLHARTGGTSGSRRLAWTDDWRTARALLRESLAELPVEVDTDEAGNLWAILPGRSSDTLLVGSHLDSVPSGGRLDGALGVMAGLELLRSVAQQGTPPVTVALVDWADEEGARFGRSLFGSAAAMGTLDLDALRRLRDREGRGLPDVLAEHGVHLDEVHRSGARMTAVKAYVEVHIEQGPLLESMGLGICAVSGTKGIERERLIFTGQASHAGTMPMEMRRDSFCAAARFALEVAAIARRHDGVATVGSASCRPGVVTATAGETQITLDMRHIDADELAAMFRMAMDAAHASAAAEGCTVEFQHIFRIPPMPFHAELLTAARDAVYELEHHEVVLPSGALHDASEVAREIPTVMIFASSTGGLSHTPEEHTPEEHLRLAVQAFDRTCRRTMALIAAGTLDAPARRSANAASRARPPA